MRREAEQEQGAGIRAGRGVLLALATMALMMGWAAAPADADVVGTTHYSYTGGRQTITVDQAMVDRGICGLQFEIVGGGGGDTPNADGSGSSGGGGAGGQTEGRIGVKLGDVIFLDIGGAGKDGDQGGAGGFLGGAKGGTGGTMAGSTGIANTGGGGGGGFTSVKWNNRFVLMAGGGGGAGGPEPTTTNGGKGGAGGDTGPPR